MGEAGCDGMERLSLLKVPKRFVQKFGHELNDDVTLTTSTSGTWRVGLRRSTKRLWFHEGWQSFVESHSIHAGYFLIFRYEGNSVFHVYMFNLTAASEFSHNPLGRFEEISPVAQVSFSLEKHEDSDESVKIRDLRPAFPVSSNLKNKVAVTCINQSNPKKTYWSVNNGISKHSTDDRAGQLRNCSGFLRAMGKITCDVGVQVNANELEEFGNEDQSPLSHRSRNPRKRNQENKPYADDNEFEGKEEMGSGLSPPGEIFSQNSSKRLKAKRSIIAQARKMATRASQMFQSVHPFCGVIMQPSSVNGNFTLHLPGSFPWWHLKDLSGEILLQVSEGKQWPVWYNFCSGASKIEKGWREFVMENYLEEGDACVFELVKRDVKPVAKVTIFRVVDLMMRVIAAHLPRQKNSLPKLTSYNSNGIN